MKYIFSLLILIAFSASVIAQDFALQQLEDSPRHHEWITFESSDRTLHNFVAYPESKENTPIVIVIHENRGLDDWARSFADQIAEAGFIAVAPDLISNTTESAEKTSDFESSDKARQAIYALDPQMVTNDLENVLEYAKSIEAGNGKIAVVGFCWGGSQSFRFATNVKNQIDAAIVFYGTGPQEISEYEGINVPVYAFYGGDDQRVNATISTSEEMMKETSNTYDYKIYDEAGHGYMRRGDDPEAADNNPNVIARNQSWERLIDILNNL